MIQLKRFTKYVKDVWNGDRIPSQENKFKALCVVLGIIHLYLAIFFFMTEIYILSLYNICSAIYYISSGTKIKHNSDFYKLFVTTYIEVTAFAVLSTVLIGWNYGFMLYVIVLSPVSFFMTYALPGQKRSLSTPALFSMISLLVFITTRIHWESRGIIIAGTATDKMITLTYNLNCIISFFAVIILSVFFSQEIRLREKELEKRNSQLSDISSVDPLTGLYNRRSMDKFLDEAVALVKENGQLFTVTIGDIDNFKMVNDIHGHNVGDDVLMMVAKTIKETLPEKSTLCRWGGEEFLIMLPVPEADAIPVIESVRYAISQQIVPVEKKDGYLNLSVTMTFGMSQYIHGFNIEKIISIADENLYKGKSNGKNRVVSSKTGL